MRTCLVDVSTRGQGRSVDVSAADVARHHPEGARAVFGSDRGASVNAMAVAFAQFIGARCDVAG